MLAQRLSIREMRVVVAGAATAFGALVLAYGVVPYYRNWNAREAQISASAAQVARLQSLIKRRDALQQRVNTLERSSQLTGKVVSGRTAALAASELQRILRLYAERSKVSIDRLEFAAVPDVAESQTTTIPLSIAAVGDIYGITDFLGALRSGSPVVEITELSLVSNTALKDGLIQFSANIRAPVVIE